MDVLKRDSFLFYRSFYEAISMLPDKERLEAYDMIMTYAIDGTEPDNPGVAMAIYAMAKPQIDANNKRYENGLKPKQKQDGSKTEAKQKQNRSKPEANENENVNDNVNVNENVINKDLHTDILASNACACARPTIEEVENYCAKAGIKIDVDAFMDRYQKSDWKIGNSPIRDWRDVVQGWYRIDCKRKQQPAKKNAFLNFSQRDDDLNALEAQLDRQFMSMDLSG